MSDDDADRSGESVVGDRRTFLKAATLVGVGALAGCNSGDDGTETTAGGGAETPESSPMPTPTPTEAPTDTPTETPEQTETPTDTATDTPTPAPPDKRVFAYYPGWGRTAEPSYTPGDVPFEKVTDILYAFLDVVEDGTVQLRQENAKTHEANLSEFADMAADVDAELHLSIGGWTLSDDFPAAAETETRRQRFADTAVSFMREYNFDGIDVDWEHPGQGGNDGQSDPEKHVQLLQACRDRLDEAEETDDREYSLSIAGSASLWSGADLRHADIADLCDHVHVMAYDMTGTWHGQAGLNAPLNKAEYDTHSDGGVQQSVEEGANLWLDNGVAPADLTLGLPFYGRGFANVPADNDGLFQPFEGVPENSANGAFTFTQLEENYVSDDSYDRYWHEDGAVPWLYSEDDEVMISYADAESITEKVTFANDNDFGGVMFWELSQDRNETLLDAVNESL
jgi:chitinase